MRSLAAIIAITASAAVSVSDGNDVRGRLDLKSVEAAGRTTFIQVTITTWDGWRPRLLAGKPNRPGRNRLTVLYDVNGDKRADFRGRVIYAGGRLSLWLSGRGSQFDAVGVHRPNRRTVTFTHPVDVLLKARAAHDIFVAVTSKTCRTSCSDRAPNGRRWLTVPVGAAPPPPPPA